MSGRSSSPEMPGGYCSGLERRLVEAVQELSLVRDLTTLTAIVRDVAREVTTADGASFVLREGDQCYYADEAAISPLWKGQRFPMDMCVSGWVIQRRQSVVIEDVGSDPRVPAEVYEPTFVKSLLIVPIRTIDPLGAIGNYWARRHRATAQERRLLQALADTTAVAMENIRVYQDLERRVEARTAELKAANEKLRVEVAERKRMEEQLQRVSVTDALTGLTNRRGFFERVERQLAQAAYDRSTCALVFVDLDGLKRVNDALGHRTGDAMIKAAAEVLRATFRPSDVVARLGGDEFAVWAVDAGSPDAIRGRISDQVGRYNQRLAPALRLSLSVGIAADFPFVDAFSLEDVLDQADRQMYRRKAAKRSTGKNDLDG